MKEQVQEPLIYTGSKNKNQNFPAADSHKIVSWVFILSMTRPAESINPL